MSGKRRATSELNRDNWDRDEPAEESGIYSKATEEVLKKRTFKTAKRRIVRTAEDGSMNAFNPASLANLTSKSHQPANQLFSFLSELKPEASKTNGLSSKPNNQGDEKVETSSPFSFGNKMVKSEDKTSSFSGSGNEMGDMKSSATFSFGNNKDVENKASTNFNLPAFSFSSTGNPSFNSGNKKEETPFQNAKKSENIDQYYARLKGLNESVAKWINKHVEDNPLINLQPIFKDYEKFFDEIEKEYHKYDTESTVKIDGPKENKEYNFAAKQSENTFKFIATPVEKSSTLSNKTETPSSSLFKVGASVPVNDQKAREKVESYVNKTEPSSSLFKFGAPRDKNVGEKLESATTASTFKFGATNTSIESTNKTDQLFKFHSSTTSEVPKTQSPPKYSFGSNNPSFTGFTFTSNPLTSSSSTINFGSVPASTPSNNDENKDEESDEPPKVEVKEVEEEGHIYMIRCKLFVKKDGNFVEKGVGNLFLKPVPDSNKIQVIVRAHNSLANVLCNFILSKSIPTQRMGKNNVMIVCIPTPESKPPPIPVLIKVKTGEDADQLLETLEKHKN